MSQLSKEETIEKLDNNIESDDNVQFDCDHQKDKRLVNEVVKYQKEVEKFSHLLKEKNMVINKLLITLSNQTQELINLEKAYHALRERVIKTKDK